MPPQVLLELRPTSNSESAELAGDAGAVGRVVMTKAKEGERQLGTCGTARAWLYVGVGC